LNDLPSGGVGEGEATRRWMGNFMTDFMS